MLDYDRLAETVLAGTKALIAKEMAPLLVANADLALKNAALEARVMSVEVREIPAPFDPELILIEVSARLSESATRIEALVRTVTDSTIAEMREAIAARPDPPDVGAMVVDAVKAAVDAIQLPEAPELPDIPGMVQEAVAAAVVLLEPPAVPDVAPMVAEAVRAAVGALPAPTNGKDADPAALDALREEIAAVRKDIPEMPEPINLCELATKEDVAALQEAMPIGLGLEITDLRRQVEAIVIPEMPAALDLSGLATKEDVEAVASRIEPAKDFAPEIDAVRKLVDAIVIPEIPSAPDLSGYAVKEEVTAWFDSKLSAVRSEMMIPEVDLSGLATKDELAAAIAAIPDPVEPTDVSGLATKEDVEAVAARIEPTKDFVPEIEAVRRQIEAIVIPEIPAPIPGRDGAGFAEAKMNADGELILKRTDGETFNVGKIRGDDGFGFDDFSFEYDGERTLVLVFAKGERSERHEMVLPIPIYRGIWREGEFKAGDCVTLGGSLFIAQRDTSDKPETSDAWRLSVKRGQDGKNGVVKEASTAPVKIGK